jgi:hypothetical protein
LVNTFYEFGPDKKAMKAAEEAERKAKRDAE